MALSNWDTLAIDQDGNPCDGTLTSPNGITVEFYKNWLYVSDKNSGRNSKFASDVVMKVEHGIVQYKDVSIVAWRGPQDGIFAAIHYGNEYNNTLKGIIGCGVSGYSDSGDFIGVTEETIREFQTKVIETHIETTQYLEFGELSDPCIFEEFNLYLPNQLRWALLVGQKNRFNQGDAFFAQHLNFKTPATEVDKATSPILSKLY